MLKKLYHRLRQIWYRLVVLKSSPRKVALGFALGVFISFTPTFGCQIALVVALAALLRFNPVSATVGVYVTNFVTVVPLYVLCYKIGCWVIGYEPGSGLGLAGVWRESGFYGLLLLGKRGMRWIAIESIGAVIIGTLSGVPSYFLVLFGVVRYRRARLARRYRKLRERMGESRPMTTERRVRKEGSEAVKR